MTCKNIDDILLCLENANINMSWVPIKMFQGRGINFHQQKTL